MDSVPAIFGLTDEPFLVFTSNVFAILGLRAMYFLLAGAMERFHLLKYGMAVVLIFVGLKMVWLDHWYGGKLPIGMSLGFITSVVAASVILSFLVPRSRGQAVTRPVTFAPSLASPDPTALENPRSRQRIERGIEPTWMP